VILLALAVYLGQGVGVVAQGVEQYRGNLFSDQYPYVVLAQFLMDEPFSTEWDDVGERPWVVLPVALKVDRIGQSIVHGTFAVTAGRDALDLFFPCVLLGPGLMVPAVFLLGPQCGLPRRWTTWAALAAGMSPGVEYLVSRCFLSHALCLATLVAFLAAVIRLARGGGWRTLPCAIATSVVGGSVYTEFAPLFAGCATAALVVGVLRGHIAWGRGATILAVLVLAQSLNPAALVGAVRVWHRGTSHGAVMKTNYRVSVWLSAVWLNFGKAYQTGQRRDPVAGAYVVGVTGGAVLGALVLAGRGIRSRRRLLPAVACAALVVPPAILELAHPESDYVIGKLVLTLAPVLVVFLACGLHALSRVPVLRGRSVPVLAGLLLAFFAVQSGLEQRGQVRGGVDVGVANTWNEPGLQQVCAALRTQERADVVIAIDGDGGGSLPATVTSAICYHGRPHRIRLARPQRVWMWELDIIPASKLRAPADLPAGTLVVTRDSTHALLNCSHEVVVRNGTYQLVRLSEPGTIRTESLLVSRNPSH
jgi:hypothetical protein